MDIVKRIALISILFVVNYCLIEASFNGSIMFDLEENVNQNFIRKAYKIIGNDTGFTNTSGTTLNFLDLSHFSLFSTSDVLQKEITEMESRNTMILMGRRSYFGLKLIKSKVKTRAVGVTHNFMNYAPVFDFPTTLNSKIIEQVFKHIRKKDHIPSRTMFILNATSGSLERPWEDSPILTNLLQDIGNNLRLAYYKNNADEIARIVRDTDVTNVVLMVNSKATEEILVAAQSINLFNWLYRWLVLLPITSNLDIKQIGFNRDSSNITVIQFASVNVDPRLPMLTSMECLCYDSVNIGLKILEAILANTTDGVATVNGKTGDFTLNFTKLKTAEPEEVATRDNWIMYAYHGLGAFTKLVGNVTGLLNGEEISVSGLPEPYHHAISEAEILKHLRSNPFRIVTVLETPYVQYKTNASGKTDLKKKLEGFVIDITIALMESLNISYVIQLEESGKYGVKQPNGQWNGMVLKIMDQRADFAAAAFAIVDDKKKVVDYLDSYMSFRGSVILKQNNETGVRALFQFLSPFDFNVWLSVLGAMIVVPVVLTIVNLVNPNKTQYTLFESFFYTMGTLFQGVATTPPDRSSGRIIICSWWFFTLIFIIAYVSNYSAYRTHQNLQGSVGTLEDLLTQGHYRYGTVKDTIYDSLLATSTFEHMQRINKMVRQEFSDGLVKDGEIAMKLVRKGDYAFIWDNVITRYYAYKECMKSTAEFEQYQYGFIIPKNADYKDLFNKHLKKLKDNGKLAEIINKYPYLSGTKANPVCKYVGFIGQIRKIMPKIPFKYESPHSLNFEEFVGINIIMLGGCVLSLILAVIECSVRFCCQRRRQRIKKKSEFLNLYHSKGHSTA